MIRTPRTYADKQHDYRKRLLIVSPFAVILVALIFITSDVVPYTEIERRFGWEGEMQVLPEITIIPDKSLYEDMLQMSRLQSAPTDADPLEETGPNEGSEKPDVPPVEEEREIAPEINQDILRHYPAHTDVSYSEDYVILYMVQPKYPPVELLDGIEGDVTVEILVNEDGLVENAWIVMTLGPRSFEEASLAAIRQFRFKPPVENGRPVPMWIRFQIRFRIYS